MDWEVSSRHWDRNRVLAVLLIRKQSLLVVANCQIASASPDLALRAHNREMQLAKQQASPVTLAHRAFSNLKSAPQRAKLVDRIHNLLS